MKTLIKVLWLILLFMTSQLWGIVMGFTMAPSMLAQTPYNPNLLVELIITASAIASVYLSWLIARKAGMPLPMFKGWTIKDGGFAIGMTILTRFLAHAGIYLLKQSHIDATANDAALEAMFANFSLPLAFIIIAICGPILEEWIFRAGLIGYLFEKYPLLGLVISTLIFGVLHMPTNLISWGIYGGIGLIYSLVYYKTKRLELVMVMHILHNTAAILHF